MAKLLTLKGVTVNYGAIQALCDVNIEIPEGQIVCLIGSNGAGKTTCVKTILGLQRIQGGQIEFEGKDITNMAAEARVELGIGCSPEGRRIFGDQTVLDNLLLGGYVSRRKPRQVKEDTAIMLDRFPILREKANQLAGTLSGGQQQILAIARALMSRPRLLLLDEPSLGLAPIMIKDIYDMVREISSQGMTILLIEQYASYALAVSNSGYVLEHGALVAEGSVEYLRKDPRVVEAYLGGVSA